VFYVGFDVVVLGWVSHWRWFYFVCGCVCWFAHWAFMFVRMWWSVWCVVGFSVGAYVLYVEFALPLSGFMWVCISCDVWCAVWFSVWVV
jgi:hypothetical protein